MTHPDTEAGPVVFSTERPPLYRYTLHRRWDEWLPIVNFIMLNPSTADGNRLDATLRRCRSFAMSWGCGGFAITNLFAYRSRDRMVLRALEDPIGPDNDFHIWEQASQAHLVVCAWGADGRLRNRSTDVLLMLLKHKIALHYLKLTMDGQPWHPLYLASELEPKLWTPR